MYHLLYDTIRNHLDGQGVRLLDIGCGTGLLCALFRDYVSEMVGVDLSMPMALTARARGCYNLIIAEDARSLRHIYPQQFDVAVMADVIPFISNITMTSIFEAVHELVRDGGLVVFTVEAAETMALVEEALQASEQDRAEMLNDSSEDEFCWAGRDAQQSSGGDKASSRKRGKSGQPPGEPQLQITARYAHPLEYLTNLLTGLPFEVLETRRAVVRTENGVPVCGYVIVAKAVSSG
jgi:predicted TPR repeat methyltransferase